MTIYTRRGDHGKTSLADGTRVSKASARVEAYGTVDEANSAVGFARSVLKDPYVDDVLLFVQQRLFNCSSSLAFPGESVSETPPRVSEADIMFLERAIDAFQARSGELVHFVIESGSDTASRLHIARAVMRRAERGIYRLATEEPVPEQVLAFVNRCSDLLFAAARYCNATEDIPEELWNATASPPAL
jgi:cob(I)alamin adenosyltransferase